MSDYEQQRTLELKKQVGIIVKWSTLAGIIILFLAAFLMWGCPTYKVWQQTKEGEAELSRAEQNRQIKIKEADAVYESSIKLARADTTRAHGIARSQEIIDSTLTEEYLRWFWIDNLEKTKSIMYVPTEAGIPIMEAGRATQPEDK